MEVPCAQCGKPHDIADLEPSLTYPDAYLAIPAAERAESARADKNLCVIRPRDGAGPRYFVRVLVPVQVHGLSRPCRWGIWSEVSGEVFATVLRLWDDPDQCSHPPLQARLANDLEGYPPTSGLSGIFRFLDVKAIPFFAFDPAVEHPFVDDVRSGVAPGRVLEWLAPYVHAHG
jgi:hypothetical protein